MAPHILLALLLVGAVAPRGADAKPVSPGKLAKLRESHLLIVKFHSPMCKRCQFIAKEWEAFETAFNSIGKSHGARAVSLDCTAYLGACGGYGVQHYPTIRAIWPDGGNALFEGPETSTTWMKQALEQLRSFGRGPHARGGGAGVGPSRVERAAAAARARAADAAMQRAADEAARRSPAEEAKKANEAKLAAENAAAARGRVPRTDVWRKGHAANQHMEL